jgi:hypothetical protein
MFYQILDIFFVVFHTALILFNLSGWIWKRTRVLNMITLVLTGSSWLFLGLITGTMGYCPLTDWHFDVLEKTGKTGLPNSYIKYLTDRLSGLDVNPSLVDSITLYAFLGALVLSLCFNIRDFRRRKSVKTAYRAVSKTKDKRKKTKGNKVRNDAVPRQRKK